MSYLDQQAAQDRYLVQQGLQQAQTPDQGKAQEPHQPGKIHGAIIAIMKEIGGVEKGRKNTAQNYSFRGIADLYLACQPLMAKHGVHLTPHAVLADKATIRETKSTDARGNEKISTVVHVRQRIQFRFYADDGSWVPCETTGEAMDWGDKASNKAMSVAAKYALIQKFAIPEEDPTIDTENASPELASKTPPKARSRAQPAGSPSPPPPPTTTTGAESKSATGPTSSASPPVSSARAEHQAAIQEMIGKKLGWDAIQAVKWLADNFHGKKRMGDMTDGELAFAVELLQPLVKEHERKAG